jgi:hypothetical protein
MGLLMVSSSAVSASSGPARVFGHYTYDFSGITGIAGDTRTVTVFAADASSPKGVFLRTVNGPNAGAFTLGRVRCLAVSGSDAWVSGPITRTQDGPQDGSTWLLLRIHDGKLPKGGGDMVVSFGETPADGLALCQGKVHTGIDDSLLPLVAGNVTVVAGH